MNRSASIRRLGLICAFTTASATAAFSHPHVFAEARLEIMIGDRGSVSELRHVWRFDELFSSTVLLDFDTNANLKLEPEELAEVGRIVHDSLADFNFFTSIIQNGRDISVVVPDGINVDYQDGQLLMFFAVQAEDGMSLDGNMSFGVYDPTMYTAIDFINDSDMVVAGNTNGCKQTVVRPDVDEILAQNQESLTEAFFNDPAGNDFSKFFATRLELKC
ncbi:DUF1007 family protein [Hoeflea sp.]|uniref:DUF1007 family protein n=1 Tax=Hoeflea sp. TaxID=1940281 RepID=UPI003B02860D